jgi:ribosomal protein S18 acetylase RimI-like enzyme
VSSEFTVREATQADLDRVSDVKVRSWADTYAGLVEPAVLRPFLDRDAQLAELREKVTHSGTLLLVAENGPGVVAGFALTYLHDEPGPWLESLHVLRELRRAGIGTLLVRATAARVMTRGYTSLRLGVIVGNDAAARFYQRLGGTMIGIEPVSWAPGAAHEVYGWEDLAALSAS